jgi:hypothetical protein
MKCRGYILKKHADYVRTKKTRENEQSREQGEKKEK